MSSSSSSSSSSKSQIETSVDSQIHASLSSVVVTEVSTQVVKRTVKEVLGAKVLDGKCAEWDKIVVDVIDHIVTWLKHEQFDVLMGLCSLAVFLDGDASSVRAGSADLTVTFKMAANDIRSKPFSLNDLSQAMKVDKVNGTDYEKIDVNVITWSKIHKVLYYFKASTISSAVQNKKVAVVNLLTQSEWTQNSSAEMVPYANPYAYLWVPAHLRVEWLNCLKLWSDNFDKSVVKATGVKKRTKDSWAYSANTFFSGFTQPMTLPQF